MNICVPLANNGYFLAKHGSVGLTEEDCKNVEEGHLDEERQKAIRVNVDGALLILSRCETKGRC